MENLSAVSYASTGACGCGQARANRLKRAFSCLPKLCRKKNWGGRCKTMAFYSSRSHPPRNSIAAVGFRFWISSKTRGGSSQRSCAVCFLIYVHPIDIARLKSGIRRTPHLFWKPKKHVGGGGYFTWSGEIFLRKILPYLPPQIFQGGDLYAMSARTFWFWWMMVNRSHAEIPGQCSALAILVLCDPKHGCYFQQVPLALPKDLLYQMNQVFRWVWVICPTSTHRGYSQKYGQILTANLYAPREAPHPLLFGVGFDPLNGGFTLKKKQDPHRVRGIPASSQVFCQLLFLAVPNVVLMLAAPMDEYDALP